MEGRLCKLVVLLPLFLVGGAIVNVAVAWGCVLWSPSIYWADMITSAGPWPAPVPLSWTDAPENVNVYTVLGLTEIFAYGKERPHLRRWELQHALRVGLPMRSLHSERHCTFPLASTDWQPKTWVDGVSVPEGWRRYNAESRSCFPTLPVWPGFAINTIFYAATLWLLFAGLLALHRWWRVKRGLCPACAYPIGTSEVCTECGKPVTRKSVEPLT